MASSVPAARGPRSFSGCFAARRVAVSREPELDRTLAAGRADRLRAGRRRRVRAARHDLRGLRERSDHRAPTASAWLMASRAALTRRCSRSARSRKPRSFPAATAEVLFAPLEAVGFPVDAVASRRWLGNRQALAQVRKRIADVEHAYHEQVQGAAHGPSVLAGVDRVLAREYEATLQAGGHPPMLYAQIGLAVGAGERGGARASGRRAERAVRRHQPAPARRGCSTSSGSSISRERMGGSEVRDYTQQLTVEQFGAMVATASRTVGSQRGPYLGYTPIGAPLPVRFDPTQAPREDRASAVLLIGTLGSGKTVAAQSDRVCRRAPRLEGCRFRPQARPRAAPPARARRPDRGARAIR